MFKLTNLDSIIRQHQHFLAQNERLVAQATETAARHAVGHVQKHPGFNPRTGKLQKATRARSIKIKGGRQIKLTNNLPYAPAIDGGARPHLIHPKRRFSGGVMVQKHAVLRFKGRGGKWVSAKVVRHPGNKPYKFGWRAIHSAHRVLGQDLRKSMSELAAKF